MSANNVKKAFVILRQDGLGELSKAARRYILYKVLDKDKILYYLTYKNHMFNKNCFDAVASPYDPILVSPKKDIRYMFKHDKTDYNIHTRTGLGEIRDGQWDKNVDNIQDYYIPKGLRERFEQGLSWEDTTYFKQVKDRLSNGGRESAFGCTNLEQFLEKRCAYVEELYKNIKKDGYCPESGGKSNANKKYISKSNQNLDPLVLIGRNGEIIWRDGYHRYSIAEMLDLKIPVQVRCRHKQWQELRDEIYNNGISEQHRELLNHPDLQDIFTGHPF